ncbi:MAG: hypothetical protein IPG72_01285 [Ardenticatenales bacterium]|nr:hypothetical protein [Ardenticatenales bacterium]
MKKLVVMTAGVGVVAGVAMAAAGMFQGGQPAVYASRLAGIQGAGATGIQVQNLDATQSATVLADFYKQSTSAVTAIQVSRPNVPAGGAVNMYLPTVTELTNGAYAAIISADRQIAAIARTDWTTSGAAAIYSNVQPGKEVFVPLSVIKYYGQTSLVSIQNTDTGQVATVTVELFAQGNTTAVVNKTYQVQPGSSVTLDLSKDAAFIGVQPNTPGGFLGSMKVTSAVDVGVQSFVDIESSQKAVYAFEGVPPEGAAMKLYAPLIRKEQLAGTNAGGAKGFSTGISVVNPTNAPVNVTAKYYGGSAECAGNSYTEGPAAIPAGSSHVFYQPTAATLPKGCVGSAVLESDGNILAIVNDSKNLTETSAAYNAVPAAQGATKVALPLARRGHTTAKFTTGIQVMNIGTGPANIEVVFADDKGVGLSSCGAACKVVVQPLNAWTFFPSNSLNAMPVNSFGSAVVTSDQPIVVIVNDISEVGSVDAATYNGIKADL